MGMIDLVERYWHVPYVVECMCKLNISSALKGLAQSVKEPSVEFNRAMEVLAEANRVDSDVKVKLVKLIACIEEESELKDKLYDILLKEVRGLGEDELMELMRGQESLMLIPFCISILDMYVAYLKGEEQEEFLKELNRTVADYATCKIELREAFGVKMNITKIPEIKGLQAILNKMSREQLETELLIAYANIEKTL